MELIFTSFGWQPGTGSVACRQNLVMLVQRSKTLNREKLASEEQAKTQREESQKANPLKAITYSKLFRNRKHLLKEVEYKSPPFKYELHKVTSKEHSMGRRN